MNVAVDSCTRPVNVVTHWPPFPLRRVTCVRHKPTLTQNKRERRTSVKYRACTTRGGLQKRIRGHVGSKTTGCRVKNAQRASSPPSTYVELFRWEGSDPHSGGVGLRDAEHVPDIQGWDAQASARPANGAVGRCHKRICT